MINFLSLFKRLLPRAKAWSLTASKDLQKFWQSLTVVGENFKDYALQVIFKDYYAFKTEKLDEWELDFGLVQSNLSDEDRRKRLDSAWKATGGQTIAYIQSVLQKAGFDVYLHDWWELPRDSVPVTRNPLAYLRRTYLPHGSVLTVGNALAMCGKAEAMFGKLEERTSYPLVNKIDTVTKRISLTCGSARAMCGKAEAIFGTFDRFVFAKKDYVIPLDQYYWNFFLYIGGATFPDTAQISHIRKDEFENLCLKLCPNHIWLGMLITYI